MTTGIIPGRRAAAAVLSLACAAALAPALLGAQERNVVRVDLPVGRSYPVETPSPINRVSVANPEVADVAVIGERDVVINARGSGETDVIIWAANQPRQHLRVSVHSPADRMQVVLGVKIAEVRRDVLRELGVSARYADENTRVGSGIFNTDNAINPDGSIDVPGARFLTLLTDFDTDDLLAFIDAQATSGNARILAEPNVMAANKEEASFLAGGELPIPIAQPTQQGAANVTIEYREFGIRLNFTPEILSDSLIKLRLTPEVSSLDFGNAILLSGFRIPAFRTRRISSTVDVKRNQSLVISGLFSTERERARTGIPFLMDIPVLGALFSSTRWLNNESELVVIVTPVVVDPLRPRAQDVVPLRPSTELPAREALEPRLTQPAPVRRP
ncbi:MAG TPA: pilus assembly protein N-terminal domain-containing protein [Gemmatimonadaceae bacterium]|nr:pilus assembly protein N-terminal domain-containing protein [Gemmatimonadaceae bacterium]